MNERKTVTETKTEKTNASGAVVGSTAGSTMTSTFTGYTVTPEYWRESVTATTPCKVEIIPQSFLDGLADLDAGRFAPLLAVMHLPAWLVRVVWFRKSNRAIGGKQ